jgi:hypothetical protein
MDHFERLHEETCPNHAYLVKHKLRDGSMMKNFIALGSSLEAWESMMSPMRATRHPFPKRTWS